ncbi:hypothetical protein RJ640_022727 [Escallonia rubra]|uniref:Calcium uniporter protein n=1 Tax=Escallonia rubra TaxID=112253 RepID=A0AA88QPS9_9ASTE|nr:hypothetical protein RJ640_022727 [Escallonia rubra]
MWRSSFALLRQTAASAARATPRSFSEVRACLEPNELCDCSFWTKPAAAFSTDSSFGGAGIGGRKGGEGGGGVREEGGDTISFGEARTLMRLVNVEALKMKMGTEGKEEIGYSELIEACKSMGVAKSTDEAAAFARVLDEAGVVLQPWTKQITLRGVIASMFIGSIFSVIAMKLNLTTGLTPSLNVSAALLAFVFMRTWTNMLRKAGITSVPFTRHENTMIQTCSVASYSIAVAGLELIKRVFVIQFGKTDFALILGLFFSWE